MQAAQASPLAQVLLRIIRPQRAGVLKCEFQRHLEEYRSIGLRNAKLRIAQMRDFRNAIPQFRISALQGQVVSFQHSRSKAAEKGLAHGSQSGTLGNTRVSGLQGARRGKARWKGVEMRRVQTRLSNSRRHSRHAHRRGHHRRMIR
jgi:hypothetical protein